METWRELVQHGRVRELRKIFGKHIADLIRRERAQKVTKAGGQPSHFRNPLSRSVS